MSLVNPKLGGNPLRSRGWKFQIVCRSYPAQPLVDESRCPAGARRNFSAGIDRPIVELKCPRRPKRRCKVASVRFGSSHVVREFVPTVPETLLAQFFSWSGVGAIARY